VALWQWQTETDFNNMLWMLCLPRPSRTDSTSSGAMIWALKASSSLLITTQVQAQVGDAI